MMMKLATAFFLTTLVVGGTALLSLGGCAIQPVPNGGYGVNEIARR